MSSPSISVIIPTFNRVALLSKTLCCLLRQNTELCYEVIIIDSGTDETEQLVKYAKDGNTNQHVIITYLKIPSGTNRSLLRNHGAEQAQADIIVFLDNDILVGPDFIGLHYEKQQNASHAVVLGTRKSLTQLDNSQSTYYLIQHNFELLDKLPYIYDDRYQYTDKRGLLDAEEHPWRFLFSHNFSMKKANFSAIGGFDEEFGIHWGYEDLELGIRAFKAHYAFYLEPALNGYHQPHYAQSVKEQREAGSNQKLYVERHPYFEVELQAQLFARFNKYHPIIKALEDTVESIPTEKEILRFPVVLSSVASLVSGKKPVKNCFLGVVLPDNTPVTETLVLPAFFSFPEPLQFAVLTQALYRCGPLYFRNENQSNRQLLISLCNRIGFYVEITEVDDYWRVHPVSNHRSKIVTVYLPEIYSPEKRFVALSLLQELNERGYAICARDISVVTHLNGEDFGLSNDEAESLRDILNLPLYSPENQCISFLNMHRSGILQLPNSEENKVYDDYDFDFSSNEMRRFNLESCAISSREEYEDLVFNAVLRQFAKGSISANGQSTYTFCSFMENGYREDGIDLVLEVFSRYHKVHTESTLVIKCPDYENLVKKMYPLHSEASRVAKTFGVQQKIKEDNWLFERKIQELGIQNAVTVIAENYTFEEISALIQQSEQLLCLGRSVSVQPEVYMAILLKKRVLIGKHKVVSDRFLADLIVLPSEKIPALDIFSVPADSDVVQTFVYQIATDDVLKELLSRKV